ncbi:MAG: glycosyltransferase family 39 protein [Deltaproteobacteria bacterium]|nr:glycosyltransferase family 39 protein [Deltaproteobacteria bacterium]
MKKALPIPETYKTKSFKAALLSITGIHLLISIFLVFRFPQADNALTYLIAMQNVESGIYYVAVPTPGDSRVALAKDGYFHTTYEPGIPHLYSFLIKTGHWVDSTILDDKVLWRGWDKSIFSVKYALIELPHLLILPATGTLVFLILSKMGCSLRSASWTSLFGILSTMILWNVSPHTRDGLGLPITVASFYFAFSARFEEKNIKRWAWYFGAGVFCGFAILMKLTTATIAIPVFFYIGLSEWRRKEELPWNKFFSIVVFSLPAGIATVLFFLDRWLTFGSLFMGPINTTDENFSLWIPIYEGIFGLLLSPGKGLFWYNPLLLLLFVSWSVFKNKWKLEAQIFLIHAIILIFPLAAQSSWAGDEAFGPRYLISLIPWGLIIVGNWLDAQHGKNAFWKCNSLAFLGILVQLPSIIISLSASRIGNVWNSGWILPHKHFWPSQSPIVILWKTLLSKLSNGYFYGNSPLWSYTSGYSAPPMVDFAQNFAWRETFFYEVIHLKWGLTIPFLIVFTIALVSCIYTLLRAVKKN